mmetsp:Transcript_7950/g.21275  ORF Transcript_7950/g.21275 Transcript_7950/m.21275 type:complete len:221 (+) Transcript_7950:979-1641(+)
MASFSIIWLLSLSPPSLLSCSSTSTCACPHGSCSSSIVASRGRWFSAATLATSAWPLPGPPLSLARMALLNCSSVSAEPRACLIFSHAQWRSTLPLGSPTHSQIRAARKWWCRHASLWAKPRAVRRSSWGTVSGTSSGAFLTSKQMRSLLQASMNLSGSAGSARKWRPKTAAFSRDSTTSGSCSWTAASMQVATASPRSSLISFRDSCAQTSPFSYLSSA